jgi:alpha-tubulin suppressor-like RCC1 family protein
VVRRIIALALMVTACSLTDLDRLTRDFRKVASDGGSAQVPADASLSCDDALGICAKDVAAGGEFSCAVARDGKVFCWGSDAAGQLGSGATPTAVRPRRIDVFSTVGPDPAKVGDGVGVDAKHEYACAWSTAGDTSCWGAENYGRLGRGGSDFDPHYPGPVTLAAGGLLDDARLMRLGDFTACALRNASVACWGGNEYGQLGPTATDPLRAEDVPFPAGVVGIATGTRNVCARLQDGRVFCNGSGDAGILVSTRQDSSTPLEIPLGRSARDIAVGTQLACAVLDDGSVACWGTSDWVANGPNAPAPRPVEGVSRARDVACSDEVLCIVDADGALSCAGNNAFGQLGRTDPADAGRGSVAPVRDLPPVKRVSIGGTHVCAVAISGSVHCWGHNDRGQLGDGTTTDRPLPVRVGRPL